MDSKQRIIQELVPGKQITLAHIISRPDEILYKKLGLNPEIDYSGAAIGVITMSPAEYAIIAADLSLKNSGSELGFVDRFSGTLVITGRIDDVESAFACVVKYASEKLGFTVCEITRT